MPPPATLGDMVVVLHPMLRALLLGGLIEDKKSRPVREGVREVAPSRAESSPAELGLVVHKSGRAILLLGAVTVLPAGTACVIRPVEAVDVVLADIAR